jgi:hypothetical protein
MKTLQCLALLLCLSLTFTSQAQVRTAQISKFRPTVKPFTPQPRSCVPELSLSLQRGSVREPNHQLTQKVKFFEKNGKFYIHCVASIQENDFIWAQFPFKPGYPSGKITGMKFAYRVIQSPNNSRTRAYISQSRMTQGPQPYQGTVRLDDPTDLLGSNAHYATPFGGSFACGTDFKTAGFKLVMQPGDVICIEKISVYFDCPGNQPVTFKCPPNLPNPKIKLSSVEKNGNFLRFRIPVYNYNIFPDFLFSPAPSLPACGLNASASRSWVDIYDEHNNRLYGFCALGQATDLKNIWFAVKQGETPPARVRIVITDRGCNKKYPSNWISIPQS